MILTYKINGMTCKSCEENISNALKSVVGITNVNVSKESEMATLEMSNEVDIALLQSVLQEKYQILPITKSVVQNQTFIQQNSIQWNDFKIWKRAAFNTLNCLLGCSIGDLSMIIYLQHYYPTTPMLTQMILAVITGLITSIILETNLIHFREKINWNKALKIAISMSFISMVAMEITMDTTDFFITGGKMSLSNPYYWLAFLPSALLGFLVPLPYNYYQLKKHNKSCH